MKKSIAITGIGLATPLGCSRVKTWIKVRNGQSIVEETHAESPGADWEPFVRFAPFLNPNGLSPYGGCLSLREISRRETVGTHRIFPLAASAAAEALDDSGIDLRSLFPEKIGCSLSVSKPVMPGPLSTVLYPDSVGEFVARKFGMKGPLRNYVAACATGIHSILAACRWLEENQCDLVIAGSAESSLHPLILAGFAQMGVLSRFPCPFDERRDGFMIGEGAGVLVMERLEDAMGRGAKVYARVLSCAIGSDFCHPTRFEPDGSSIASVVRRAVEQSGLSAGDLGYVNLHGTGTRLNDLVETRALRKVFGGKADGLACSSTKSSTGHLLGAAAAVEAALCCLAIRDGFVPPTVNLESQDRECDLDCTPNKGRPKEISAALSLSFGFGGPIGAIILGKP